MHECMELNRAVWGCADVNSASLGLLRIQTSVAACPLGCSRKRLRVVRIRPDPLYLGADQICTGVVYSYVGPPGQPTELHTLEERKSAQAEDPETPDQPQGGT